MNLSEIFTNQISAILQSINYKMKDGGSQRIDCRDSISSIALEPEKISFVVSRNVLLDALSGYTLQISVEIVRLAKNDIDLTISINENDLKNITQELSEPVMNYVSLLVSQITSSFNRQPIITPPTVHSVDSSPTDAICRDCTSPGFKTNSPLQYFVQQFPAPQCYLLPSPQILVQPFLQLQL